MTASDQRPAPLVPLDCDLRDFEFMPLDVRRLRDSGLAAEESPASCWAALLLWGASWHQVPASSIPNDDRWIAKHAGYMALGKIAREWTGVRAGALRSWVECSDGRLYHPVVAEKARDAWEAKLAQRWRCECARVKKHNQRHDTNLPAPTFEAWRAAGCPVGQELPVPETAKGRPRNVPRDKRSKGQGQGQGQGQGDLTPGGASHPSGGTPPDLAGPLPQGKKPNGRDLAADAREVLAFLNERAGKRFPDTDSNVGVIVARFREGFDKRQARQVVAMKVRAWKGDEKMAEYLRPMTLFGRQKFSSYVGELVGVVDDEPGIERDREPGQ